MGYSKLEAWEKRRGGGLPLSEKDMQIVEENHPSISVVSKARAKSMEELEILKNTKKRVGRRGPKGNLHLIRPIKSPGKRGSPRWKLANSVLQKLGSAGRRADAEA